MAGALTPQDRAERSARAMLEEDAATRSLGISLDEITPGACRMSMTVRDNMLNGHGMCHGGFIFLLADSAFAFACNGYNQRTVAAQNQITYVAPARLGDVLTATAREISRSGRSGTWDVEVRDSEDRQIALFRGLARTVGGQHFPEPGDSA